MEDYSEEDFDEQSAREVTCIILQKDIKAFKKFLKPISKMDKISFCKMFKGDLTYKYPISNIIQFNLLLDKFNNFHFLLEEWYTDKNTYDYIKELWLNYISMESLREKNPGQIKNYLISQGIQFDDWKDEYKKKFIEICRNTKDRVIEMFKKVYANLPESMKKLAGNLVSFGESCKEAGNFILGNFTPIYIVSFIGTFCHVVAKDLPLIKDVCLNLVSTFKQKGFNITNFLNFFKANSCQFKELATKCLSSPFATAMYGISSLLKIFSTVEEYKQIDKMLDQIKIFEDQIKKIRESFKIHQKEIEDILKVSSYLSPETLNSKLNICVSLIKIDKENIQNLLSNINFAIKQSEDMKTQQAFSIAGGIVQVGIGVTGAILTCGLSCVIYGVGAIANAVSVILSGINIDKLKDIVKKLKEKLEEAKALEKDINKCYDEIQNILKENEKVNPKFCEK
jgi:hypothetical protein